jgi:LysM repeat protein
MLWVSYAIRKNDWLGLIATRHHVSLKELLAHNPAIRDPDHVPIGTVIKVPIDNSVSAGEIAAAKDSPPPILTPHATAPDGAIIRLPDLVRLPYYKYGWVHITQERLHGASVTGSRVSGYHVSFSLPEGKDSPVDAGKRVVEQRTAGSGLNPPLPRGPSSGVPALKHKPPGPGLKPPTGGPMHVILSLLDPTPTGGLHSFLVRADNGAFAQITIIYPTE